MGMNINDLPDDVLLKILSLLFLAEVVATSVLSKRWRYLYRSASKLKIGNYECSTRCIDWISSSETSSNPPFLIKSLDFELLPQEYNGKIMSFVQTAAYRGLRELRIELLYTSLRLPVSLYTLETLILCRLHLVDNIDALDRVRLCSLKSLSLLSVKFSSDEAVRKLLSICPVLKELVVRRSAYTNVGIFTINVPTLMSLSIDYLHHTRALPRPASPRGFVVNAPYLTFLNIRDLCSNVLQFTHMPRMVKASVEVVCDQSESLMRSLGSVRHLSLCSKISNIPYHADTFFFFLEHLELCTCSAKWWKLLTRILKEAPRLRVLELKSIHCAHYNDDDPINRWNQPSSVPKCLSSRLETLEWRQYKGTKLDEQVAKYILANASHLKTATFFSSKSTEKHQMFKKLEFVPVSSMACQLSFF